MLNYQRLSDFVVERNLDGALEKKLAEHHHRKLGIRSQWDDFLVGQSCDPASISLCLFHILPSEIANILLSWFGPHVSSDLRYLIDWVRVEILLNSWPICVMINPTYTLGYPQAIKCGLPEKPKLALYGSIIFQATLTSILCVLFPAMFDYRSIPCL